ncbi:hypothetical protein G2W53_028439 [Senna tora]|uniref:Uncharacterized protein n=1 Tax=Senna tora TaxID=362788 RepID=A0A834T4F5_9FABA|nr:hypothetical protein G2W53_028439 [Senna tora]
MSPSLMLIMSPGTNRAASSSLHFPSLRTFVLGARPAINAAAAFPALFSSMKLIVELMISNTTIPTNSFHHPRKRIPHEAQEFEQLAFFLLFELVVAEDFQSVSAFLFRETIFCTFERNEYFFHWYTLLRT